MKRIVFLALVFMIVVVFGTIRAVDAVKVGQNDKVLNQQNSYFSNILQNLTYSDESANIDCNYNEDGTYVKKGCKSFYKRFVKDMKFKKYCEKEALANNCVPVYKNYTTDKDCIGFSRNMIDAIDDVFVAYNGVILIVANDEKKNRLPMFAIDVNGLAGPNIPGEDLFTFTIVKNEAQAYYFSSDHTKCLAVDKK